MVLGRGPENGQERGTEQVRGGIGAEVTELLRAIFRYR